MQNTTVTFSSCHYLRADCVCAAERQHCAPTRSINTFHYLTTSTVAEYQILNSISTPGSLWYLFLRTQQDSFELSEVEAGVGLGITCPLQGKLPAASPPLFSDFTEVGLDGKHPPLPAATSKDTSTEISFKDSKLQVTVNRKVDFFIRHSSMA